MRRYSAPTYSVVGGGLGLFFCRCTAGSGWPPRAGAWGGQAGWVLCPHENLWQKSIPKMPIWSSLPYWGGEGNFLCNMKIISLLPWPVLQLVQEEVAVPFTGSHCKVTHLLSLCCCISDYCSRGCVADYDLSSRFLFNIQMLSLNNKKP